jgi:FKBP-type peptidyl-prolyl cis-trans isomerase SlyD
MPSEYHQVGAQATFKDVEGKELLMTVVSIENGEVFLDGNHPFAGKTLKVSMTVTAIRDATVEEIGTGLSKKYQQNQSENNRSKNNNLH